MEEGPELAVPRAREEAGLSCSILGTAVLNPTEWLSSLPGTSHVEVPVTT